MEWVFAKAEKLPFEDESFDIVTSVYLFHELPENIRLKAANEMRRVLKKGALLVHMDSLQLGDVPHLDPSLEIFPHLYYEPYYKNYISQKTESILDTLGFINIKSENTFYSKVISCLKSE